MPRHNIAEHGTHSRYRYHGCRCTECREAERLYCKRRREGRGTPCTVDPAGTIRRLQALAALGWTTRDLAHRLDVNIRMVEAMRAGAHRPYRRTAARVARLYDQMSMTPGPSHRGAATARGKGWAPPLAWEGINIDDPASRPRFDADEPADLDEVKVMRACHGRVGYDELTHPEQAAAIRRLHAAGLNDGDIARRLHGPVKTVGRRRMRLDLPANAEPGVNAPRSA